MDQKLWDSVVKRHGHTCAGVALGYRIGLEVLKIFDIGEPIACVTGVSNCAMDGVCLVTGLNKKSGSMRYDKNVEGFIFYAQDDDEGWQIKPKTLELAPEADPVLMILAASRDLLYTVEPVDEPLKRV